MQFRVSDYRNWIDEKNQLSERAEIWNTMAKHRKQILALTQEELQAMFDKIEDMYYR